MKNADLYLRTKAGIRELIQEYSNPSPHEVLNPNKVVSDLRDLLRGIVPPIFTDLCIWAEDEDGNWKTECGEMFTFLDDGPKENGFVYCHHCGKPLGVVKYVEPQDDEE